MILGVSIRCKGGEVIKLPAPNRHGDCFIEAQRLINNGLNIEISSKANDQGFYTDNDHFIDRRQAMRLVNEYGIPKRPMSCGSVNRSNILFSEDIW